MQESVQDLIHRTCWDRRVITLPDEHVDFIILSPTLNDRNMALHVRRSVHAIALDGGALSEQEIIAAAISGGSWTSDNEQIIESTEDQINEIESKLLKEKLISRRRKMKIAVSHLRQQHKTLRIERASMTVMSAEYLAHEQMVYTLIKRTVRDANGNAIWHSDSEFRQWRDDNVDAIDVFVQAIVNESIIDIVDVRRVARSAEWRLIWTCNRDNLSHLFGRDPASISLDQKMLVYWSKIYDMAYESPDRPGEAIVNDDDKFDVWFQNKIEELAERKVNTGHTSAQPGKRKSVHDHHEQGVVLDGYYSDDCSCGAIEHKGRGLGMSMRHANNCPHGVFIKYTDEEKDELANKFYGRNPDNIRSMMNSEHDRVIDEGLIEEQHLRGKKTRMILGSDQKVHARRR